MVFPSCFVFWNSLRIGLTLPLKCSVEFASGPGLVFVHSFWINDSISLLVFSLFKFSILVSVLVIYMFLGIYPFFYIVQIVGIQSFIIFFYNCLHFCGVDCYFYSLFCDFIGVLFLFFLITLAKALLVLLIFSKNQLLASLVSPIFVF